ITPTCRTRKSAATSRAGGVWGREERGSTTPGAGAPAIQPDAETTIQEERAIVCAACGHSVTREKARLAVTGSHIHTFKNPSAIDYTIGCFREAHGAQSVGERSTVWTWFPGYAWQVALCARCGVHLGWSFHADGGTFWGLILERLRD